MYPGLYLLLAALGPALAYPDLTKVTLRLSSYSEECLINPEHLAQCQLVSLEARNNSCRFVHDQRVGKENVCAMFESCGNEDIERLRGLYKVLIRVKDSAGCKEYSHPGRIIEVSSKLRDHYKKECLGKEGCTLDFVPQHKPYPPNAHNSPSNADGDNTVLSRNSVLFVAVSFILLMVISLAWLVFYYVQRFRYIHSKERVSRCLADLAKKAVARIPVKTLKPGDKEIGPDIDQCAICIETYRPMDNIRILPCRHFFHKQCIDPWLLEQRSCPMCKLDILHAYGLRPELGGCSNSTQNANHNSTQNANHNSTQNANHNSSSNNAPSVNQNNQPTSGQPQGTNSGQTNGNVPQVTIATSNNGGHLTQAIQIISSVSNPRHSTSRQGNQQSHHMYQNSTNNSKGNRQTTSLLHHHPQASNQITFSSGQGQFIAGQSSSPHSSSLPSLNAILDYHDSLFTTTQQLPPGPYFSTQAQPSGISKNSAPNPNQAPNNKIIVHKSTLNNNLIMSQSQHFYNQAHHPHGNQPIVVVTSQGPHNTGHHLIQSINSELSRGPDYGINNIPGGESSRDSRVTNSGGIRGRISAIRNYIFPSQSRNNQTQARLSGHGIISDEAISEGLVSVRTSTEQRRHRKHRSSKKSNQLLSNQEVGNFRCSVVTMPPTSTSGHGNQLLIQASPSNQTPLGPSDNRIYCQNYQQFSDFSALLASGQSVTANTNNYIIKDPDNSAPITILSANGQIQTLCPSQYQMQIAPFMVQNNFSPLEQPTGPESKQDSDAASLSSTEPEKLKEDELIVVIVENNNSKDSDSSKPDASAEESPKE